MLNIIDFKLLGLFSKNKHLISEIYKNLKKKSKFND